MTITQPSHNATADHTGLCGSESCPETHGDHMSLRSFEECDECGGTGWCYVCGGYGCRDCDFTGECPWCEPEPW